jgi:hypothetical protein
LPPLPRWRGKGIYMPCHVERAAMLGFSRLMVLLLSIATRIYKWSFFYSFLVDSKMMKQRIEYTPWLCCLW